MGVNGIGARVVFQFMPISIPARRVLMLGISCRILRGSEYQNGATLFL
jgi:hypothetical protein